MFDRKKRWRIVGNVVAVVALIGFSFLTFRMYSEKVEEGIVRTEIENQLEINQEKALMKNCTGRWGEQKNKTVYVDIAAITSKSLTFDLSLSKDQTTTLCKIQATKKGDYYVFSAAPNIAEGKILFFNQTLRIELTGKTAISADLQKETT